MQQIEVPSDRRYFVCRPTGEANYPVCKKHGLWSVNEGSPQAMKALQKVRKDDLLIFRINMGYTSIFVTVSGMHQNPKPSEPWQTEGEVSHNGIVHRYGYLVKMKLVTEFDPPIPIRIRDLGIKFTWRQGMGEISKKDYDKMVKEILNYKRNILRWDPEIERIIKP